jgi:hypothetical protein
MTSHLERVCKSFSARQIAVAAIIGDKAMLHEPPFYRHSRHLLLPMKLGNPGPKLVPTAAQVAYVTQSADGFQPCTVKMS